MRRFARVVTPAEIERYFQGSHAEVKRLDDGIEMTGFGLYRARITQGSIKYNVRITSVDDPLDQTNDITSDPITFISSFLQAEGEVAKVSSGPDGTTYALLEIAALAESGVNTHRLTAALRRVIVSLLAGTLSIHPSRAPGWFGNMDQLEDEIRRKKWDVANATETKIEISVHEIFEAVIRLDDVQWNYEFSIIGADEVIRTGRSSDPIAEFKKFYQADDVENAVDKAKRAKEKAKLEESQARTVRARPRIAPN
jgi:hypothetical protein